MSTRSLDLLAVRRRAVALLLPLLLPLAFGACATTTSVRGGGDLNAARLEPYDGPRARIAVAAFTDKTGEAGVEIGDGLATMLTTGLVNGGRFIVLERDLLDEVLAERDLAPPAGARRHRGAVGGSRAPGCWKSAP
jgi:curli biogenesis system outer membrane secretion channel CsgG